MISWLRSLKGEEARWSINCDYHNWTLHDLSKNEARILLESLRDSQKATVLVWRTGWPKWRDLRDPECSELLHTRIVKIEAPPIPSNENFDPEITAVRPLQPKSPFLSRKFTRFDVDYPASVISGTQEFKTRVADISAGGLRTAEPLPEWVAGYCTVLMTVEGGKTLEIMCSLAEDQKHQKTRLEIVDSGQQSDFLDWFRNHPRFQG